MPIRDLARMVPGMQGAVRYVVPSRRREAAQWKRIGRAIHTSTVQSGPFAGMQLVGHADASMILGCYEAELHPLVASWAAYDRVIDVGCAEGWYVVGLARRMPTAQVWGIDVRADALRNCAKMAATNGVEARLRGEVTPAELGDLVRGRTLIIVDIEGAEVEVLDPEQAPELRSADILVEMHDFLRPGATDAMRSRFGDRQIDVIPTSRRDPSAFPILSSLSPEDQRLAVSDNRPPDSAQQWLWMEASG